MVESFLRQIHEPCWESQARWRTAVWNGMARLGMTGMHGLPVSRQWVEICQLEMPLHGLSPNLEGFRIAQISDLHFSPVVWRRYLAQMLRYVNDLEPDLVVVTGDLISGGYRYADRIARLLGRLHAPNGVLCTFGNHDYSMFGKAQPRQAVARADFLERRLVDHGMIVLRNQVYRVGEGEGALCIVGLDDEWSGRIDPDAAFEQLNGDAAVLCLNHNPANVQDLLHYPWQWMLSGHTHGRQVGASKIGRRLLPGKFRHYVHGYYAVHGRHLYVNRGLSYGQRVRDWCRPEITLFTLKPA